VHGANRLASNSLLEGLVFGARAAEAMKEQRAAGGSWRVATLPASWRIAEKTPACREHLPGDCLEAPEIRGVMWRAAGVFRTRERLSSAIATLDAACAAECADPSSRRTVDDWRRFNLLTVARLIARAALRREESRGGHYRGDFPERDDAHWRVHLVDCVGLTTKDTKKDL